MIATLLLNHCQQWFEFVPLEIPYNYLHLIENILMKMDNRLYLYYKSKNITSQIYALPLMKCAFSEVLDEHTWLQLWDHLMTNESYFMIFVIVAYNSLLRTTIMRCDDIDSISRIFYEQNFVNIKAWMKKSYAYMKSCPPSIHPKNYMTKFIRLSSHGEYQTFEQTHTAKNLINKNVTDEISALREEQKMLDKKLTDLESYEQSMASRIEHMMIDEENQKRMKGKWRGCGWFKAFSLLYP
jgi:hypothetical protein